MESMGGLKRSHSCNDLGPELVGQEVTLMGWVLRRRDHGGVIFIDLRDRRGITQVVFSPEVNEPVHAKAHRLRSEWVIAVRGRVSRRPATMENPNLATGAIEILADELRLLNASQTPPFPLDEEMEVSENLRLKYRYLDLLPGSEIAFIVRSASVFAGDVVVISHFITHKSILLLKWMSTD